MLKLRLTSLFVAIAIFQYATARFEHASTREKFVKELSKSLFHALATNNGRINFDVFRIAVMRYEYDCKRHAINKIIQSHLRVKERTNEIEQYYNQNRYQNFADQQTFKFKESEDIAGTQKMSDDVARRTVMLCANMESIKSGQPPNLQLF